MLVRQKAGTILTYHFVTRNTPQFLNIELPLTIDRETNNPMSSYHRLEVTEEEGLHGI